MNKGLPLSRKAVVTLSSGRPHGRLPSPIRPAAEALKVRLIGHNDLQGRTVSRSCSKKTSPTSATTEGSFESLNRKNRGQRNFHRKCVQSSAPQSRCPHPRRTGAESRAVQVAVKYFDGKDYLLRNQESGEFIGFEVWDITDKANPRWSPRSVPPGGSQKLVDTKTGYAYLSGTHPDGGGSI